ncbi:MAG: ArsR/SmtB family transcription factor [Candidatus Gallimonas sp.]
MDCNHENEHHLAAERAKATMPQEESIAQVCAAFKAISEPSRLKILLALRQGEMCVYHIVEAVGGTQSAVSHQLRILRDNRMIRARRDGQNVVYALADGHVRELLDTANEHLRCPIVTE